MRVVAWNCMGAFERKTAWLAELAPDLAIVSEVTKAAFEGVADVSGAWTGGDDAKGLAVFGRNGWRIEVILDAPDRHVLAVTATRGEESLTIVGVWTLPVNRDYVVPIVRGLSLLREHLTGDVLIAGDFNANPVWDAENQKRKRAPFAPVIADLRVRGIRSVWYERSGEEHGAELVPTFHLYRHEDKPFHIDYVFASEELRRRVEAIQIGTYADWVATKRSDHVPIIVDFVPLR